MKNRVVPEVGHLCADCDDDFPVGHGCPWCMECLTQARLVALMRSLHARYRSKLQRARTRGRPTLATVNERLEARYR